MKGILAGLLCLLTGFSLLWAQEEVHRYEARNRRDPFVDLHGLRSQQRARESAPPPLEKRPPGLAGLLISEVSVSGTALNGGKGIAILKGVDQFTYLARVGSRLYDGYVAEISKDGVVFVQEGLRAQGERQKKTVKKSLQAEGDGR